MEAYPYNAVDNGVFAFTTSAELTYFLFAKKADSYGVFKDAALNRHLVEFSLEITGDSRGKYESEGVKRDAQVGATIAKIIVDWYSISSNAQGIGILNIFKSRPKRQEEVKLFCPLA